MQGNWNAHGLRAIITAREEAARLRHAHVGTEHLLLGIVRSDDPLVVRALTQLHISPVRVREEVERRRPAGQARVSAPDLPLDRRAQGVLSHAEEEAQRLSFGDAGPAHMLLGIAHEDECLAACLLADLGHHSSEVWVEVVSAVTDAEGRRRAENEKKTKEPEPTRELPAARGKDTRIAMRHLQHAQDEARRMRAAAVGTEHVLLALAAEEWGVPAMLLRDQGIDEARIREEVARLSPPARQADEDVELPLTKHTKSVWKKAQEEAQALGHATVRGEHLFLALLSDERGFATTLLASLGLKLEEQRERLLALLCPEPQEAA